MARIVFFNIPAHGHTNPTLAVVRALTAQGHEVIYYSFEPFRAAIEAAGARFISCDRADAGDADGGQVARDLVASTALIVRVTLSMDEAVTRELEALKPDVIVADSVAFWGKLFALKLGVPLVSSCTTFAFNRHSAKIMKSSAGDLLGMLWKLPRAGRLLKPLRDKGYPVKGALDILQNDPELPTVVYTSTAFQPAADTFPDNFHFACARPASPGPRESARWCTPPWGRCSRRARRSSGLAWRPFQTPATWCSPWARAPTPRPWARCPSASAPLTGWISSRCFDPPTPSSPTAA